MKTAIKILAPLVIVAVITWTAFRVHAQQPEPSMARWMPQGALLFMEASDFGAMLHDWSASAEKQAWLKSDNYQVFSRSRLLGRLQQAQGEFSTAAGVPPDMKFLDQVAGDHSALAIYDIGKLEFLCVTRLQSSRAAQSAIWQQRSKFEPRQAAGKQFFIHTEPDSGRVVAFAVVDDHLILATREDLIAGALSLISGEKLATLDQEKWFTDAIASGNKEPGVLRMAILMEPVTHTPQFRTYWIQQNITDLRDYESALSDLYVSNNEYREERLLIRGEGDEMENEEDATRAAGELSRMVPADVGFYQAFAGPDVSKAVLLLEEKILTPKLGPSPAQQLAPNVALTSGTVGSQSDLETRIDVAPVPRTSEVHATDPVNELVAAAKIRAVLTMQRSDPAPDKVFVRGGSTVILSASNDWDYKKVQNAFQQLLAPGLTSADLGVGWQAVGSGAQAYWKLDGLHPVAFATRGKYLYVSNDEPALTAALQRTPSKGDPADYVAGFNHARERANFYHLTAMIDRNATRGYNYYNGDREPEFFSGNIASLSRVFANLESETITVRKQGLKETQTVRYRWAK